MKEIKIKKLFESKAPWDKKPKIDYGIYVDGEEVAVASQVTETDVAKILMEASQAVNRVSWVNELGKN